MAADIYRVAIVGASSLAGKELSEVLSDSPLSMASFALFDDEQAAGKIAAAADEISFVRRLEEASFDGMNLVFFAGDASLAREHLAAARRAGADIIDLTGGLERAPGAAIFAAGLEGPGQEREKSNPAADGPAVMVVAHPGAQMLATLASQVDLAFGLKSISATMLIPASEYGRPAVDELHRQTVNLLGFQPVPQELYDVQVAFNLVGEFGEAAPTRLDLTEQRIAREFRALVAKAPHLSLQIVHAPVFHGIAASIFAELVRPATAAALQQTFPESTCPSPLSVSGQSDVAVRARVASGFGDGSQLQLWSAADNLRLLASSALACAMALRGGGKRNDVQ